MTIRVHPFFLQKTSEEVKNEVYAKKIAECLSETPMSLSELAIAMGYKGITKKMRDAVDRMLAIGELEWIVSEDAKKQLRKK